MTEPALIVHGHWLSPPSAKVVLALRMADTPFAYRHVDLLAGEQNGAAFRKLNRFGQVPVIEHEGVPIAESSVILVYLAVKLGKLDGATPPDRLRVREWLSWEADQLFWLARRRAQIRFIKGAAPIIERYGVNARRSLGLLDEHLATHPFIVGERPTIADVAAFATTCFADEADLDIADWPNIVAWQERMRAEPGCALPYEFMPKENAG